MTSHADAIVEAVLSGEADDAVPVELEHVATLVRAAQAEPSAAEIEMPPWLLDTLASSIDDCPATVADRRAARIGRRVAVVTTSLVLATSGMAAATGHLPDPAQAAIARAARHVGVDLPEPVTGGRSTPPPPAPTSTTSSSDRPSSPSTTVTPPAVSTPAATAPAKDCAPPADRPECAEPRGRPPLASADHPWATARQRPTARRHPAGGSRSSVEHGPALDPSHEGTRGTRPPRCGSGSPAAQPLTGRLPDSTRHG